MNLTAAQQRALDILKANPDTPVKVQTSSSETAPSVNFKAMDGLVSLGLAEQYGWDGTRYYARLKDS